LVIRRLGGRPLGALAAVAVLATLLAPAVVGSSISSAASSTGHVVIKNRPGPRIYPVGIPNRYEPSGLAPPGPKAFPGYVLTYQQDFTGAALPSGWGKFNGVPSGDPGSMFAPNHVLLGGGMVRLVAFKDRANGGDWATGGMCQCAVGRVYGAYFVRSRVTGPGPNENELLWPVAHVWPPEVDFNEMGLPTTATSATVHYGTGCCFWQNTHSFLMTRWHTWGVVWTATALIFTIDGRAWSVLRTPGMIPHRAMTLDIQQQTWCNSTKVSACPTHQTALQIDWVAEYRPG
jgi:hypothetical protein